jgi:hypothetical protein
LGSRAVEKVLSSTPYLILLFLKAQFLHLAANVGYDASVLSDLVLPLFVTELKTLPEDLGYTVCRNPYVSRCRQANLLPTVRKNKIFCLPECLIDSCYPLIMLWRRGRICDIIARIIYRPLQGD